MFTLNSNFPSPMVRPFFQGRARFAMQPQQFAPQQNFYNAPQSLQPHFGLPVFSPAFFQALSTMFSPFWQQPSWGMPPAYQPPMSHCQQKTPFSLPQPPAPYQPPPCGCGQKPSTEPPAPTYPLPPVGTTSRVWGDPHFEGLFHGVTETEETGDLDGNGVIGDTLSQKYDFQGQPGQILNILSDTGLQVNGRLEAWGAENGSTIFQEMGLQVRGQDGQIYALRYQTHDVAPALVLPGGGTVLLQDGQTVNLGGTAHTATWNAEAKTLSLKTPEYDLRVLQKADRFDGHLELQATVAAQYDGQNQDGVLGVSGNIPLIGGVIQDGHQGAKANGEGVATRNENGVGANRSPEDYVVHDGLFGLNTPFNSFST